MEKHKENWEKRDVRVTNWVAATELGKPDMMPWNIARPLAVCTSAASQYGQYRACLVNADFLTTALGRPNREQVVTTRLSAATTLQALELSNGSELNALIDRGAADILTSESFVSRHGLISRIYRRALGRSPTENELVTAKELLGRPVEKQGLEDILWSIAMLPEFQLIY